MVGSFQFFNVLLLSEFIRKTLLCVNKFQQVVQRLFARNLCAEVASFFDAIGFKPLEIFQRELAVSNYFTGSAFWIVRIEAGTA